jgi:peptidoglycan/LPS O-acetylase OafA/YrhL
MAKLLLTNGDILSGKIWLSGGPRDDFRCIMTTFLQQITGKRLREVFDPKANALNAFRLALAVSVIFYHAYPLSGRNISYLPARHLLGALGVDGFFALSGFLITGSWLRRPDVRAFCRARALRILPGFYVCLILTAFIFAPIGTALAGGNASRLITSGASLKYVFNDLALYMIEIDIAGTPTGVPFAGVWNGSLWTLQWEMTCYFGILLFGVFGLMRQKWTIPVATLGAWIFFVLVGGHLDRTSVMLMHISDGSRFALVFMVGALVQGYAYRLRVSWSLVMLAFAAFAASMYLHDYVIVGIFPYAYALVGAGALLKTSRLNLKNDYSYGTYIYAFPIQQVLASAGLATLPIAAFAGLCVAITAPFAVLSWFIVEKVAMKYKAKQPRNVRNKRQAASADIEHSDVLVR